MVLRNECRGLFSRAVVPLVMLPLVVVAVPAVGAPRQVVQCSAKPLTRAGGHWVYRTVEGRKCWYKGPQVIDKANLHWPKPSARHADRSAKDDRDKDARAEYVRERPEAKADEVLKPEVQPAQSNETADTFEARWRGDAGAP